MSPELLGVFAPALAVGLLVLATHVPLGRVVLARGIIFIDLAVAQVAALGAVAAARAGFTGWAVSAGAFAAAVAAALALRGSERRWPGLQEALIGVLFVLAASAGMLLLATDPHGARALKDLLAGQILWSGWREAGLLAALYLPLLALWHGLPGVRVGAGFYLVFAAVVTASVQVVGVYLVFASLILPALAAHGADSPRRGYAAGAAGYALGLTASAGLDLPAGPAIVVCLAVTAALAAVLPPRA